jgi:hypothetical protein
MKTELKALTLLLMAASLGSCGLVNVKCGTDGFTENSTNGHPYAWQDGSHLEFRFADNVPDELRTSVTAGANTYNSVFTETKISFDSKTAPAQIGNKNEVSGDGINGIYIVSESNWFFYKSNPGAVAVTNNLYSSDEIIETDIFFLVKDSAVAMRTPSATSMKVAFNRFTTQVFDLFSFVKSHSEDSSLDELSGHTHTAMALSSAEGVTATGMYASEFNTVKAEAFTVHELGHSLGRCHSTNKSSIMQAQLSTSVYTSKPFLSEYDLGVLSEYYTVQK